MPCHDDWDYKNFVKVSELSVHILCCSWDTEKMDVRIALKLQMKMLTRKLLK